MPFAFEGVPRRKILNWILVEASLYLKPERPWGWPTHLQVGEQVDSDNYRGSGVSSRLSCPAGGGAGDDPPELSAAQLAKATIIPVRSPRT